MGLRKSLAKLNQSVFNLDEMARAEFKINKLLLFFFLPSHLLGPGFAFLSGRKDIGEVA